MAHFLQRLTLCAALAVGSAVAQQPRPFSHRLHLKLRPECVACHTGAASSGAATDNNLPIEQACRPCHDKVSIKKPLPRLLTKFNHKQHLQLGNVASVIAAAIDSKSYLSTPGELRRHLDTRNACVACHRGLDESDDASKAVFPQMADCLVCHNKIDPPFSCETCHAPGGHLKPASHTQDYVDLHSSGKANLDKASCAVCHGRRFTCLGCH